MDKEYFVNKIIRMAYDSGVNIDSGTIVKIVNNSVLSVIEKGRIIRHIGEKTVDMGLVLEGITRCYYIDGEGNDITRGFSAAGTLCMDDGMFGYTESFCECEALEDTTLMVFKVEYIKKLIYESEQFKTEYLTLLEKAMRYKIYRENGFLVENATERYVHFRKLFPEICDRVAQHHIATYLGIAPESLSRIKKAMKENEMTVL